MDIDKKIGIAASVFLVLALLVATHWAAYAGGEFHGRAAQREEDFPKIVHAYDDVKLALDELDKCVAVARTLRGLAPCKPGLLCK